MVGGRNDKAIVDTLGALDQVTAQANEALQVNHNIIRKIIMIKIVRYVG